MKFPCRMQLPKQLMLRRKQLQRKSCKSARINSSGSMQTLTTTGDERCVDAPLQPADNPHNPHPACLSLLHALTPQRLHTVSLQACHQLTISDDHCLGNAYQKGCEQHANVMQHIASLCTIPTRTPQHCQTEPYHRL